jgi:hypothetical protein
LLRLLRLPSEALDELLGDVVTETLARILAGAFDGDAEALFAAICDREIDEYARDALLGAATFLTWDGRIDIGRMTDFLVRFDEERLADPQDCVWVAWQESIALLGLRQLALRAEAAWADSRISDGVLSVRDFLNELAEAERAPDDPARLKRRNLGYVEDVLQTLEMWPLESSANENWPAATDGNGWPRQEPVINPLRKVGRNDPCPCGSGKKAKKCCLA